MADHLRKQIRDKIITLVTGLTTTGSNVFRSRVYPQDPANLPGLLVYSGDEESGIETIGPGGTLVRLLDLVIEAQAQEITNLDDQLDQICKEVETAICSDRLLTGSAKDVYLASTEIVFDPGAQRPTGSAKMVFRVEYATPANDPTTSR